MSDDRLRLVGGSEDTEQELVSARLIPFTLGAQRYLDRALAGRQAQPVPPLRLNGGRVRWAWVGGAVAAAAAAVLFVAPSAAKQVHLDSASHQASHSQLPQADRAAVVVPGDGANVAAVRPSTAVDDRTLQSLDTEAQRLWRAGDLDGATRTFKRMTEQGGDHRYVELAFGDLVSLARQRGQAEQTRVLWREYLGRFPRGRFALDARAAVCGLPGAPPACSGASGAR